MLTFSYFNDVFRCAAATWNTQISMGKNGMTLRSEKAE